MVFQVKTGGVYPPASLLDDLSPPAGDKPGGSDNGGDGEDHGEDNHLNVVITRRGKWGASGVG